MERTETTTTIEGTQLVAGPAPLQWHEAVAIIQQVAQSVRQVAGTPVPDLSHIQLSSDGAIAVFPGSPAADQPVTQLARTLTLLLERAVVPPALTRVLTQAAAASDQSIDRFIESLQYFERPDRQAVLRAAVERVAAAVQAAEAEARMEEELKRLAAKARGAEATPPAATTSEPPRKSEPGQSKRPRKSAAPVLLVLVILVLAAVMFALKSSQKSTATQTGFSALMKQASQGIAQAYNGTVGRLFADGATRSDPGASDSTTFEPNPGSHVATGRKKTRLAAASRASAAGGQLASPAVIVPSMVVIPPQAVLLTAPDLPLVVFEPEDPEPGRIYTRVDPGVTPPLPLQPFIGRAATDGNGVPGDMDVLVDRTGAVERVILLVPNRYQDRMLIFAMKNRRFAPAMAHGRPVRYLLRVRTAF